ncbi:glutamyl-tRNA synthetase [Oscillochloris trichoides DG-6]|uniref:Glutamate--tRNA ligase n=1 Tax=Oscillochloris trichoides DG-6 TaxID=765420 RepID=E1IBY9_9CHLR|nr:glutamate--tRNA ligase [Oscillochloris trichoides]EFO81317.1 glutamyl-tRNA synthetase [Oscillochloris trichoides DG-6]
MAEITGPVRVRFAPSPTGYLHIGGVRTALFNWLFAHHYGGQFILRLEDTDEKRFVQGAADDIMASLRWVGVDWDEGPDIGGPHAPYVQSQRKDLGIYQHHAEQLVASGHAYKCFVNAEEEEAMRAAWAAKGERPERFRFRGPERDWTPEQVAAAEASGRPYTIRLKVPLDGATSFSDLIRGGDRITINHADLYDLVLLKTSGMPTYHLAHLVDDHLMGITHVIRGEEWVPSAPYHILLYQAFGWELPIFAHVPNIMRQDGKGKLSKRKDDVSTNRFWERGYLPEAMFNYLALQGWSYDDKTEIMSRDEIVERFTIDRVLASPARWNPDKLKDMNGIYIRSMSAAEIADRIVPYLVQAGMISDPARPEDLSYVLQLVPLIHERLEELQQAPELLAFFFQAVPSYDPKLLIQKQMDAARTLDMLRAVHASFNTIETWTTAALEAELRTLVERFSVKPGQLFGAIRVAVSGRTVAPPLFDTLAVLGRERCMARVADAAAALE